MPLYRPSELRAFLDSLGASPKKGLSQNFLIDGNIVQKIVEAADVETGDLVIEIGSGPGVLTELLLEKGCSVVAIEKDAVFAQALKRFQGAQTSLEIVHNDVLQVSLADLLSKRLVRGKKAKLVANIPYHLTAPIIEKAITERAFFSRCVIMIQEEVARRIVAAPQDASFGHLSLFVQFFSHVRYCFHVKASCFYPKPRVDSAVICMDMKEELPIVDNEGFFLLTRTAFTQRRKMIKSSLSSIHPTQKVERALVACHKDPQSRPEDLSLAEWLSFYSNLY